MLKDQKVTLYAKYIPLLRIANVFLEESFEAHRTRTRLPAASVISSTAVPLYQKMQHLIVYLACTMISRRSGKLCVARICIPPLSITRGQCKLTGIPATSQPELCSFDKAIDMGSVLEAIVGTRMDGTSLGV